jgi:glycosyltransferase involved in cell wall biosynthesis
MNINKNQISRGKLMFVVTEDWYFLSHRLPVARAARDAGYQVIVVTRVGKLADQISNEGFTLVELEILRRSSRNPFRELRAIAELVKIYRFYKPDVVHHVAIKPVLYGSIAAWLASVPATVNALAGLGFIFSSQRLKARLLRPVIRTMLRCVFNLGKTLLIIQNPDDGRALADQRIVSKDRLRLIKGSGVDVARFYPMPELSQPPVVLLASRMIWDKGVSDFFSVAKKLKDRGVNARFVLTGKPDTDNPAAVPITTLETWNREGVVEWWGYRSDMPVVFSETAIVCLPTTYGEGVPKVLIEAAACGKPIIAYDVPGCREIVQHGKNGFLVEPGNLDKLAAQIELLLNDSLTRAAMGRNGRQMVELEFAQEKVIEQTLAVYSEFNQGKVFA